MGIPVLIMGESGSGKTYSIKNFDPSEVGIFMCEKTRLPFKKKFNYMNVKPKVDKANNNRIIRQAEVIMSVLQQSKLKSFVIDDSQYLMANEFWDRAYEKGYDKFTDIGVHFRNLIHMVNEQLPDDVIVYFLHHTEFDSTSGKTRAKSLGKMVDQYLVIEGCFDIVLRCVTSCEEHWFQTQSDGVDTAKSPEEMFDFKIPNDLKLVDTKVREYYEIGKEGE